jgi:hypothetical protein
MPKFWRWFSQVYLGLPAELSWSWWRGLSKSPWSRCRTFRDAVLAYERCAYKAQAAAGADLEALNQPGELISLTDALVRQHLLLRRDGVVITERILHRLDKDGAWKGGADD